MSHSDSGVEIDDLLPSEAAAFNDLEEEVATTSIQVDVPSAVPPTPVITATPIFDVEGDSQKEPSDSENESSSSDEEFPIEEETTVVNVDPLADLKEQQIIQEEIATIVQMTATTPYASHYSPLVWDDGYENWKLVKFATAMDGSCLFHAVANAFFEPYHTLKMAGAAITREELIKGMRKELSETLARPVNETPGSLTHYQTINGGNTLAFSAQAPEFALAYMQSQLDSVSPIGYGYIEFICNALDKDIYILDGFRHDIYISDELRYTIKGTRNSIVLCYMNGHYELMGIANQDGTFSTHFSPEHSLIRFLYARVQTIVS
jgi:hypothetical protein